MCMMRAYEDAEEMPPERTELLCRTNVLEWQIALNVLINLPSSDSIGSQKSSYNHRISRSYPATCYGTFSKSIYVVV